MTGALQRILAVAVTDYRQFVYSKTFLISLLMVPLLVLLSFSITFFARTSEPTEPRRFLLVDRTGVLEKPILEAAQSRNQTAIFAEGVPGSPRVRPEFIPLPVRDELSGRALEALEIQLSERIRANEAFAFLIIEEGVFEGAEDSLRYYARNVGYQALPRWIEGTVNKEVTEHKLKAAGYDPREIQSLRSNLDVASFSLVERVEDGEAVMEAERANQLFALLAPLATVAILFFCVSLSSPVLLNAVIEEKMGKIAEVLLAAVSPLEILWGKLCAAALITLTLAVVYVLPSLFLLASQGLLAELPPVILWTFPVFLLLALVSLGGIWAAIGAACAELKDAQNFAFVPAMLMMIPFLVAFAMVEAPDAPFGRILSMIPPFYAFLMPVRLAVPPGPPLWEVLLGFCLTLGFAGATVWLAARIFRKGLLETNRTPSLKALWKWIRG